MMKKMMIAFVLCSAVTMTACVHDGPLPGGDDGDDNGNLDAGVPSDPDACPVPPDATPSPIPPNMTFVGNPTTITDGESSTLTWTSNADHCIGSWGPEWLYVNGSTSVSPTETTTYWLACYARQSDGGLKTVKSVTVTVIPAAPTLTLTANPTTITAGDSSTVSWTSTHTTSCSSSGGAQPTNGSWVVSPTSTTTYSLSCTGPGGSITQDVTVTVNQAVCEMVSDCNDGRDWTGDACDGNTGTCMHWTTDCGGMQVRPASNAAECQFWGGYGMSEPAPLLGTYAPSSLPTGPAGGDWKAAPQHACSVICYNPGLDETTTDIQTEWNGLTFQHQQFNSVHKGTWDGQNLRY